MAEDVLASFLRGEIDPAGFRHTNHLRMGFEVLRRHDFAETAHLYSRALRLMAVRAGNTHAFHQTITIASLSLISERIAPGQDFADFTAENPDLLEKSALLRWYRPERLASDIARRTFLLP